MEELLKPYQFHRLHDPGIANHQELDLLVIAVLRELHQSPQTGGIDEIDLAQVQDQRLGSAGEVVVDEREKLLLGVRIQLPGETEQKTSVLLFKTTAERDGQSLQISDGC